MDCPKDPSLLFYQSTNVRRLIIVSYWVVVFFSVPLWWHATSIERLGLPTNRVLQQAQQNLNIQLRIGLHSSLTHSSAMLLDGLRAEMSKRMFSEPNKWTGLSLDIGHGTEEHPTYNSYDVLWTEDETYIQDRSLYVNTREVDKIADLLDSLVVPFPCAFEKDHRVFEYAPRYKLAFSLLNEDSTSGVSVEDWNVAELIESRIQPLLSELSILHSFTIESQVQFHAPLAFDYSNKDPIGLTQEDLTVFVNSAEWSLSSSSSNDPVLHFIIFVPSSPLSILSTHSKSSESAAFILPQWGSIILYNPHSNIPTNLDLPFANFSKHLSTLLGVPRLPEGLKSISGDFLTSWQLDALLRRRTLENDMNARDTLRSTVQMVSQIEGMPVDAFVRGEVEGALNALEQMHTSTMPDEIARLSATATTLASRAFFHPGMLAMLYFPTEHKYAVYTPLFASALIPLLAAAIREITAWRRQQAQAA